jgi:hypothetical protein
VEPGESWQVLFVTSNVFNISSSTSFPPPTGAVNSLEGADWHVSLQAFVSGLLPAWDGVSTPWKAILSDSVTDANTRFSVPGKVFNTQGELLANGSSDFWDGALFSPVRYDENGSAVSTSEVWSGSSASGSFSGLSCGDWSDSSAGGEYGDANTAGSAWLQSNIQTCSNTARLYGISPVMSLPESADFNGDLMIDGLDFLILQQGLGTVGPTATHAAGDANGDDVIDGGDLAVWELQYGAVAAVSVVPEPGSSLLTLMGLIVAIRRRR